MPRRRKINAPKERDSDNEMYGFDGEDDEDDEDINFLDKSQRKSEALSDEEVYGFGDSDEDEDEDNREDNDKSDNDFDMGSDIEEEDERLPDDRAWGKSSRRFYNTDYVDQDYDGFYQGKEAEEAELEEQEAIQIQKRLAEQLNEADFALAVPPEIQSTKDNSTIEEIKTNVSELTVRQKLDLLEKESPEFFFLVEDLKIKLIEMEQDLLPLLNYFLRVDEAAHTVKYLKKKFLTLINYCTNISFYLLLKAKRLPVKNHPVLKSLYQYRKLMEQIQILDELLKPQLQRLLESIKSGAEPLINKDKKQTKKNRNILELLSKKQLKKNMSIKENDKISSNNHDEEMELDSNHEDIDNNQNISSTIQEKDEKRAITYEMAKNKGLMPKRNKAQRNPRVKHRKKYKKALVRRRGQVRMPRREIPVYGGEPTGIKVGVTKSIKFK